MPIFSHPPRFIPQLLEACTADIDLVIGSRYIAGGKITNWPWYRRLSSRLINGYSRWWLGITPLDCSGAFRCHRVSALRRLDLEWIAASGYAFYEESLLHFCQGPVHDYRNSNRIRGSNQGRIEDWFA